MSDDPPSIWERGFVEVSGIADRVPEGLRDALLSRARLVEAIRKKPGNPKPWQLCQSLQDAASGGSYKFDTPERLQRCFAKMQRTPQAPTESRVLFFARSGTKVWGSAVKPSPACSAVRCLPMEILGETFLFATGSTMDVDARETLLSCILVCKAWQHAAVATHRLWSTLRLCLGPFNIPEGLYVGVPKWFQHAGSLPRTLEFCSYAEPDIQDGTLEGGEQTNAPITIANLLRLCDPVPHALSLLDFPPESVKYILRAIKGHASFSRRFLKNLRIDFRIESRNQPWDSDLEVFHNLPPVEHLDLCLTEYPPQDPDYAMEGEYGWADYTNPLIIAPSILQGLSTLRVAGEWVVQDVVIMLKGCSNLQILTVDRLREDFELPSGDENTLDHLFTDVPKLHTLHIHDLHFTDNVVTLLSTVKAPELERLHIEFCAGEDCAHMPASDKPSIVDFPDSDEEECDEVDLEMELEAESVLSSLTATSDESGDDVEDPSNERFLSSLSTFVRPCRDTLHMVKILNHGLRPASIVKITANLPSLTHLELS